MKKYLKLYLILETDMLKVPLEEFIPAVIKGGVTAIQLRDKGKTAAEIFQTGREIKELLKGSDVMFVVNDRVDIALALGADVCHVGIKDVPLADAKKVFPKMKFGYSCNDMTDIKTADAADYIGVGPAFFTDTKADLRGVLGASGIKELLMHTEKHAVAIGGINENNISELKGTGVSGVAISSAICASENPYETAKALAEKVKKL